jgi:hypothetical protein
MGRKEGYAHYGCISATGDKLPFWMLTKEKTDLCHREFRMPDDIIIRHKPTGWTNEDMMREYLSWLSELVQRELILLVLDVYPAHRTSKVQEWAQELHIDLLVVPAGGKSVCQPLGRRIFGKLKSRARRAFEELAWRTGVRGSTPDEAIAILVEPWRAIPAQNIRSAWELE